MWRAQSCSGLHKTGTICTVDFSNEMLSVPHHKPMGYVHPRKGRRDGNTLLRGRVHLGKYSNDG